MAAVSFRIPSFCFRSILCLFACLSLLPGRAAMAQEEGVPFDRVFRQLAEKFAVPLLVEGTPLRAHLSEDEFLDLWIPNETAEKALSAAATLFDYQVMRRGDSYLLLKRYTSPFDLPDVSLGEIETATLDIVAILDGISPPVYRTDPDNVRVPITASHYGRELIKSITEEQWRVFESGPKAVIPFADLSPEQRGLLQKITLDFDFGKHRDRALALLRW